MNPKPVSSIASSKTQALALSGSASVRPSNNDTLALAPHVWAVAQIEHIQIGPDTPLARQGFVINRIPYWCKEAKDPKNRGKKFPVKYDPEDLSRAWVWINEEWTLCRSREFCYRFKGLTEKEVRIASMEFLEAARTLREKSRVVNSSTRTRSR